MSYNQQRINYNRPIRNNIFNCLNNAVKDFSPNATSECIDKIIQVTENQRIEESIVGKTTIHAYRRLHEIIASSLDSCISMVEDTGHLLISLARAKVMIKYQESRGQISKGIANLLMILVNGVEKKAKEGEMKTIRHVCSQGRLLLDSIAVLVYDFDKKHRRRSR